MANKLGVLLKQRRLDMGLTMKEVSEKIFVHHSLISTYEKGKRNPSLRVLKRLSEFYSIPYQELLSLRLDGKAIMKVKDLDNAEYTKMLIKVLEKKNNRMVESLKEIEAITNQIEVRRIVLDVLFELE